MGKMAVSHFFLILQLPAFCLEQIVSGFSTYSTLNQDYIPHVLVSGHETAILVSKDNT